MPRLTERQFRHQKTAAEALKALRYRGELMFALEESFAFEL